MFLYMKALFLDICMSKYKKKKEPYGISIARGKHRVVELWQKLEKTVMVHRNKGG